MRPFFPHFKQIPCSLFRRPSGLTHFQHLHPRHFSKKRPLWDRLSIKSAREIAEAAKAWGQNDDITVSCNWTSPAAGVFSRATARTSRKRSLTTERGKRGSFPEAPVVRGTPGPDSHWQPPLRDGVAALAVRVDALANAPREQARRPWRAGTIGDSLRRQRKAGTRKSDPTREPPASARFAFATATRPALDYNLCQGVK